MKYGEVVGIDKPISRLAQGVMMLERDDIEESFAIFDEIHALGGTIFDTAHGYGKDGSVDRLLGAWINSRGVRDKVVILGKGAHPYNGVERVTPEHITSDLHDSLERMELDHIDLYILHRDNPSLPVGPIVEVLNDLKNQGKISAFGGSNWTYQRLQEANDYASEKGLTPFAASSIQFSLAEMVEEPWKNCLSIGGPSQTEARSWYEANQMPVFNWSSLAGGFFSGRFNRNNLDTFDNYFDKLCVKSYCYEDNFKRLDRAQQMADERGMTLPQIAMAYLVNQKVRVFPITGCRSADEFAANAAALELELTPEELGWLDLSGDTVTV